MDEPIVNLTMNQKKIAFAQNPDAVQAAVQIIKECCGVAGLIGETEFETVVNAATLDAQQNLMTKFLNTVEFIQKGGLVNTETP